MTTIKYIDRIMANEEAFHLVLAAIIGVIVGTASSFFLNALLTHSFSVWSILKF